MAIEIYPRLLTGPVVKSSPEARQTLLLQRYPELEPQYLEQARGSEDAFDAVVSALVMSERQAELTSFQETTDRIVRREGVIWNPGLYWA
jgi:hypothetical protein